MLQCRCCPVSQRDSASLGTIKQFHLRHRKCKAKLLIGLRDTTQLIVTKMKQSLVAQKIQLSIGEPWNFGEFYTPDECIGEITSAVSNEID